MAILDRWLPEFNVNEVHAAVLADAPERGSKCSELRGLAALSNASAFGVAWKRCSGYSAAFIISSTVL